MYYYCYYLQVFLANTPAHKKITKTNDINNMENSL